MQGIVTHTDGRPAADITVSTGGVVTTTDTDGRFTLNCQTEWGNFVVLTRPTGYTASPWWHRISPLEDEKSTELRFELVPEEQSLPYQFLHLSDPHLTTPEVVASGDYDFAHYAEGGLPAQVESFLGRLSVLAPKARCIMLTGDLTDHGLAAEFDAYRAAVAGSPLSVHAVPGNHDHMNGTHDSFVSRNNYLTNQGDPSHYEKHIGPRWYSFDVAGLHVVALDWHSHELGIDHEEQNAWLSADLSQLDLGAPYILLSHDQPGSSIVNELPWQPIATFSGHWHASRVVDVKGSLHVNTPAALFAGLDYSPPTFRHVTWDGESITLRTEILECEAPATLGDIRAATFAPALTSSADDAVLWQAGTAGAGHRQRAAVSGNTVFIGGQIEDRAAGTVEALDLDTGELRWQTATGSSVKTTPALAGDVVIVAEVSGDLLGLDAETGTGRWRLGSSDPLRRFAWGTPTVANNIAYMGDASDLRAVDALTGEKIWHRTDLSPHHNLVNHAAPLIIDDLLVMGFFPTPADPIGLDTRTGESVWQRSELNASEEFFTLKQLFLLGTATYDAVRDVILIPAFGSTIALDRESGRTLWMQRHPGGFSPASPIVTDAGYLVTVAGYGLRMLDPATGATIWDTPVTGDAPFPMSSYSKAPHPVIAPPTIVGAHLLLPGLDGVIRRFDLQGQLIGTTQLASPIAAELVLAGDRLIAVGTDGVVLALDTQRVAAPAGTATHPEKVTEAVAR
ncbi:PQQ-binding-like beta-propeller repeat protein [Rhodococcus sp. ARC_M6]|uniref:outer membrane protein assembly factor BamB family protein n=1 Tax=Rhodococcus sp. ARC_M6 TaxID=2928852 RepID=UPI001FB1D842|nr:PQQ-binding-like beta-propeller repeat protein [Rhodococcus sp. ARC_M6]MCJ0902439.1 PQQ-binding-like beta-propeller repeat protein [Rhodococcus sp. ARC_M6]